MGKSVNKVILLGNVGKDPEIRATPGGTMVVNFTLATTERAKDQQGNWQDKTEWHNLVAFNRTAEIVRDYVQKGSKIYIEGRIQTQSWEDKNSGERRYKVVIIVNEIALLGGRNDGENGGAGGASHRRDQGQRASDQGQTNGRSRGSAAAANEDYFGETEISDDDIPF